MYISCKLVTDEFTSFLRMLHAILIAYIHDISNFCEMCAVVCCCLPVFVAV